MLPKRQIDDDQAATLGEFLRAARLRLPPAEFGVPAGQRRRTSGLRREEVAALCGISTTWYTWIEQGRTRAISVTTLAELAQGLRLSTAERAYLFQLAGRADSQPAETPPEPMPLAALVDTICSPAYVLDRYWNAVAWNDAATTLFADWLGAAAGTAPNLLHYVFLSPRAPAFIVGWQQRAERLAAEYRADSATLLDDAAHHALVDTLSARSSLFKQAWSAQKVLAREGGARGFLLADGQRRDYWQFTLKIVQPGELKLVVLSEA